MELLSSNPTLVLLQETKLASISPLKLNSFLPRRLNCFHLSPTDGASGGILTTWPDSLFSALSTSSTPHTISVHLSSTITNFSFFLTNIYAPSSSELRPQFLDELRSITAPINVPWMPCGDFNMIHFAHEKNNDNFRFAEAESFNDCINEMCLIELPLLDRAFINLCWDELLPNTILSSLTRTTSDLVPLRIDISTSIPKAAIFRFENYWIHSPGFFEVVHSAWGYQTRNSDPAAVLASKLKETRTALRAWRKTFSHISQQETDYKIVINLLDFVEERRPLTPAESRLRSVIVSLLSRVTHAKLTMWKQ